MQQLRWWNNQWLNLLKFIKSRFKACNGAYVCCIYCFIYRCQYGPITNIRTFRKIHIAFWNRLLPSTNHAWCRIRIGLTTFFIMGFMMSGQSKTTGGYNKAEKNIAWVGFWMMLAGTIS